MNLLCSNNTRNVPKIIKNSVVLHAYQNDREGNEKRRGRGEKRGRKKRREKRKEKWGGGGEETG